jgi:sulfite exporter TauE/SafE
MPQIDSPLAALLAGLVTSVHCAAMCGPLACAIMPGKDADAPTQQALYHGGRVVAYTALGALGGALGAAPLGFLGPWALYVLPWALVAYFGLAALRLDRWIPKARFGGLWHHRITGKLRRLPAPAMAAGFGLLTPLLPCGPLYAVLALSAFTGDPLRGAEFMIAFAVGTVPLLWLAQNRFGWVQGKFGPDGLARIRAVLALAAALLLTWRLRATFGLPGPTVDSFLCG